MNQIARLCDTNPMLNAMSYVARGIPVFPIIPDDKRPIGSLVPKGFQDRSANIEKVRAWWTDRPRANIGIVPSDQGLVVLDEDLGADPALVAQLPPTMVVRTPSGGRHHYYDDMFGDYSNADFAPKINVRHGKGYVLAPGSSVNGKLYTLETSAKAAIMPAWMRERLAAPAQKPARERTDGPPVSEDELKATLSRINPACSYNDWARCLGAISATPCDGDVAQIALDWSNGRLGDWQVSNACGDDYDMETKLDTFRSEGVTYATLHYLAYPPATTAIPDDIARAETERQAHAKAEIEVGFSRFLATDWSKASDLTADEIAEIEAFKAALPPIVDGVLRFLPVNMKMNLEQLIESLGGVAEDDRSSYSFWEQTEFPAVNPVFGGLVNTTSRMLLVAPTGLGKTHFAMAIAGAVAAGKDLLHWEVNEPRKVLYIDGEMPRGLLQERLKEMVARMNLTRAEMKTFRKNFFVLSREIEEDMPPLNTIEGQEFIEGWLKRHNGVDLITFDNIQSLLIGEQDEKAWLPVKSWIRQLSRRQMAQIWVHHANEEGKGFGTKTREWEMSTVLTMRRPGDWTDEDGVRFDYDFQRKARERKDKNRADFRSGQIRLEGNRWSYQPTDGRSKVVSDRIREITIGLEGATEAVTDKEMAVLLSGEKWGTLITQRTWERIRGYHKGTQGQRDMAPVGRLIGETWHWQLCDFLKDF
jgi:hypothetical protein